jgi:hypothetical protein
LHTLSPGPDELDRLATLHPTETYLSPSPSSVAAKLSLAILVTPCVIRSCIYRTVAETVMVLTPVKGALGFEFTTTMSVTVAGTPPLPGVIVT